MRIVSVLVVFFNALHRLYIHTFTYISVTSIFNVRSSSLSTSPLTHVGTPLLFPCDFKKLSGLH